MDNKLYYRGLAAQGWYNFTEALVYMLLLRPTPKDLVYKSKIKYGKDKLQYINTFSPRGKQKEKKPVMIYIHGGGWISGITEMRNSYITHWAKKGFFVASVSYSYAPQKVFPAQLQEVFSAVDFLYEHKDEYGIDMDNIILAGESAGGYYISQVMSAVADLEPYENHGLKFKCADSIKIKALVSLSGCFDFERLSDPQKRQSKFPDMKVMCASFFGMKRDEFRKWLKTAEADIASPKISEKFAPTFLIWATRDMLKYEAFDMAEDLEKHGIKHEMFKIDDISAQHAWSIVLLFKKSRECLDKTFEFVLPFLPEYF